MGKQPPLTGASPKKRDGIKRLPDGKVASERGGRALSRGTFTDQTKGKSAGTTNIRRTGGASSKGS